EGRLRVVTQLAFQTKAYPQVLKYGGEWTAAHADDTVILDLLARAHYIGKDYKSALEVSKTAIGIAEAAGKNPDELWLQLVPDCASKLGQQSEIWVGFEKLVRFYGKTEHWKRALEGLLSIEKNNDLATFYAFRLMADVGVLAPDYYFEYSQRAVDQALPGEALKVLETGFEQKVIGADKDKEHYQRTVADVRSKAQTDRAQLPALEKEWRESKSRTGQLGAGLGLAYFGYQMYDQAIQTLEPSFEKGGLRNVDDYRMTLGIAYLRTGKKDKAREQFQQVPANSPLNRVAQFWIARTYN
ncbi:MAG TPA: hypothetical protein VET48_03365, partial [Steroidobacteraceae bacterium]|nr:hypothetical protein [Steroidobacteraceae bacterium]